MNSLRFNIKDKIFTTTLDIVCNTKFGGTNWFTQFGSWLKEGRIPAQRDSSGAFIVVDRNADFFQMILDFLETGRLPEMTNEEKGFLFEEAEAFSIVGLCDAMQKPDFSRSQLDHLLSCTPYPLNLRKAYIPRSNLSNLVIPKQSKLSGSCFCLADLSNSTMENCEMIGVDFASANLGSGSFVASNLDDVCWKNTCIVGANFSRCSLKNMNFQEFENKDLTGVNFSQTSNLTIGVALPFSMPIFLI
eukprot:TRINITY_DN5267_c0_g1_i4.p1 TRINITY_DN5267_c0_g1~~TRINITY_DN5267_c0_g1_i4.p1  ORF type:complete len:246 (-),score=51.34 TRINITY_DN5267_c0_g1_i4:1736-2473(-)